MALIGRFPSVESRKRAHSVSGKHSRQVHQTHHKRQRLKLSPEHNSRSLNHTPLAKTVATSTIKKGELESADPAVVTAKKLSRKLAVNGDQHDEEQPIAHSVQLQNGESSSIAATKLAKLLQKPVRFRPATSLTYDSEMSVLGKMRLLQNHVSEHQIRRAKTSNLSNFWPAGYQAKPAGLFNAHNFCYRRSVLQAFLHSPAFCSWLQRHTPAHHLKQKSSTVKRCLACDFKQLAEAIWVKPAVINIRLKELDLAVRQTGPQSVYPWTGNSSQADAHEFLCWMVDTLEQRHNVPKLVIEGLFKLRVLSQWICEDCSEVHTSNPQDETGLSLQLKSPAGAKNILDYVGAYFSDTVSDARCENLNCRSKRDRRRTRTIGAAPRVLFVQLQRFESHYNAATRQFRTNKIDKDVRFPQELDLSAFAHEQSLKRQKAFTYKLSSVVAHSGTLRFGHYVAFAEGPTGAVRKFDDEFASASSMAEMLRPQGSFVPYILTYVSTEPSVAKL